MILNQKTVSELPLSELWIGDATIDVKRNSYLTRTDIKNMLNGQLITFVVANIGEPLKWVKLSDCYHFWKNEAEGHVANEPNHIDVEDFPDKYAFIASKWTGRNHDCIILLEKVH